MKKVNLQFSSIIELVDFTLVSDCDKHEINTKQFIITGIFSEADLELAKQGFGATEIIIAI